MMRPLMIAAALAAGTGFACTPSSFAQETASPAAKQEPKQTPKQTHGRMRIRDIVAQLSPEGQRIFNEAMREQPAQARRHADALRVVRGRIAQAMQAPTFDAQVLDQLFQQERDLAQQEQSRRHDVTIKALSQLSTADRRIFAAAILRGSPPR